MFSNVLVTLIRGVDGDGSTKQSRDVQVDDVKALLHQCDVHFRMVPGKSCSPDPRISSRSFLWPHHIGVSLSHLEMPLFKSMPLCLVGYPVWIRCGPFLCIRRRWGECHREKQEVRCQPNHGPKRGSPAAVMCWVREQLVRDQWRLLVRWIGRR